jgi:hypothetical protein
MDRFCAKQSCADPAFAFFIAWTSQVKTKDRNLPLKHGQRGMLGLVICTSLGLRVQT